MKNLGYKFSLLAFFIALLYGFYIRLPLLDNLVRSFVIYLIFSALYLTVMLLISQLSLITVKNKLDHQRKEKENQLNHATPNVAK